MTLKLVTRQQPARVQKRTMTAWSLRHYSCLPTLLLPRLLTPTVAAVMPRGPALTVPARKLVAPA